eukprot:scaffold3262_cov109-Isochrysis_galbana.AAC.2
MLCAHALPPPFRQPPLPFTSSVAAAHLHVRSHARALTSPSPRPVGVQHDAEARDDDRHSPLDGARGVRIRNGHRCLHLRHKGVEGETPWLGGDARPLLPGVAYHAPSLVSSVLPLHPLPTPSSPPPRTASSPGGHVGRRHHGHRARHDEAAKLGPVHRLRHHPCHRQWAPAHAAPGQEGTRPCRLHRGGPGQGSSRAPRRRHAAQASLPGLRGRRRARANRQARRTRHRAALK